MGFVVVFFLAGAFLAAFLAGAFFTTFLAGAFFAGSFFGIRSSAFPGSFLPELASATRSSSFFSFSVPLSSGFLPFADGLSVPGLDDSPASRPESGLSLLAWDADMFRVAEVIGIQLDEASLRAG